ncbi:hypothetical protein TWF506_002287 [Arthrobotrys conoides]|uniref:Uncharacterized protein n=1 Tax=Arthrobotrys conoides TaxID=74498 RepID=A0AAN8NCT3_9PEZI
MAHAAKRPRLHGPKNPTLTLPATTPKLRTLQIEHENSLRQSAQRLKTSWEDICRRYGRDFEGKGDEIDIRTGEVVVDNGHLRGLKEDLEDTWGGGDDDEEGDDAGSATSSLEMELLARRPMLARDEMGGPMLRDDEAEEIDVDEDLDRDAIDDLFDELELTTGLTGKDKRRREKDQKIPEAHESVQKEQSGQDSMPSPASSEPVEQDEDEEATSTEQPAVKENGMNDRTVVSPDELPPDDIMLEYVTKLGRQRLLALVQTLQGPEQQIEMEDPAIVAQLTPISDCGRPLSDQLGEAVEKLAASKEPISESVDMEDALEHEPEQVSEEGESGSGSSGSEIRRDSESPAALEPLAEIVQRAEDGLDCGVEALPPTTTTEISLNASTKAALDTNIVKATTEVVTCKTSTSAEREWDFIIDIESALMPQLKPAPALEPEPEPQAEPEPKPTSVQPINYQASPEEELHRELVLDFNPTIEREVPEESQLPTMENQQLDPNFHYGDIDDLSTIIVPKAQVPVTPKNRQYSIRPSSSLRKAISSRKQGRRRLSETGTPKRIKKPKAPKEPRTPTSKRVKYDDEVERKLHTPRSGKFLEYVKMKAAKERDSTKKDISVEGPSDAITSLTSAEPQDEATIATPTRITRYDYGLSDSDEDLVSIESQDPQTSSSQAQKRTRGRPRKVPVPLIAPDLPAPSPKRLRSMGISTGNHLTKCGNAGYRCGKALCFKCSNESIQDSTCIE